MAKYHLITDHTPSRMHRPCIQHEEIQTSQPSRPEAHPMKNLRLFRLACLLSALPYAIASATEFQYAEFEEISYTQRNGSDGLLLSFVTDPGRPVLVMSEDADAPTMRNKTYEKFFDQLKIGKTSAGDSIRALNVFGRNGWEVISSTEKEETVFTEKLPAKRVVFLLKKTIRD